MVSEMIDASRRHCPKRRDAANLMTNAALTHALRGTEPNCNECELWSHATRRAMQQRAVAFGDAAGDGLGIRQVSGRCSPAIWRSRSRGYRAVHAERRRGVARAAQARRRDAGRRQQPHFRRHQVSHPVDLVACRALCRSDRRTRRAANGEPLVLVEANIGQGVVAAPLSKYARFHTRICRPIGLTEDDCRARLRLRRRAHRLRLRPQEHSRPDALSVADAGAAALAPPHDGARLRPSDPHHLLGADRAGVRDRALSDPAQGDAASRASRRGRRSSRSATPRSMRRATSTSRPISRW